VPVVIAGCDILNLPPSRTTWRLLHLTVGFISLCTQPVGTLTIFEMKSTSREKKMT
jgi:hypothetical protein